MMRVKLRFIVITLSLFIPFLCGGCENKKPTPNSESEFKRTDDIFPVPYFPEKKQELLGIPISDFSKSWVAACIYSEDTMNAEQLNFFKSLQPMQDDGTWRTSFKEDFDLDSHIERVNYGAYQDKNAQLGNFVLVTRKLGNKYVIILLHEFNDDTAHFACFYLITKDRSLFFGNGLVASELNWQLSWIKAGPLLTDLSQDYSYVLK